MVRSIQLMDSRLWRGVRFVSQAPTRRGEPVELRVTRMTLPHVLWWHSHVQPVIDRDPERADRDWNWLLYVPFSALAGGVLARQPVGYTVGILASKTDRFIPCALLQLLGRFPALDAPRGKSVFAWFLSTAPDEALLTINDHPIAADRIPKRLGTITLDVAVTHSFNKHRLGRTALYADEEGGQLLLEWYQRQGMSVLPAQKRLPRGPRRLLKPSDGRYCYHTMKSALEASRALDPLR